MYMYVYVYIRTHAWKVGGATLPTYWFLMPFTKLPSFFLWSTTGHGNCTDHQVTPRCATFTRRLCLGSCIPMFLRPPKKAITLQLFHYSLSVFLPNSRVYINPIFNG